MFPMRADLPFLPIVKTRELRVPAKPAVPFARIPRFREIPQVVRYIVVNSYLHHSSVSYKNPPHFAADEDGK
jgi:hypothetical protein